MMFSFTSLGGKIDNSVNKGRGPYTFRMGGQNVHRIGSLLPLGGKTPKFCQLYIYDTEEEVHNRKNAYSPNNTERFNDDLIRSLQRMIDEENTLAMSFRKARDRLSTDIEGDVSIRLISRRDSDGRTYNRPTASEVAILIEGDIGNAVEERDVIIEKQSGELQRISELHPKYLTLQYPLLFLHGEDRWRPGILHSESSLTRSKRKKPRNQVTMREWAAFRIQERSSFLESPILLLAGKLLHQFFVDLFMMVESQRLSFLRYNQPKLRADTYKNLTNAVERGETAPSSAGSRIFMSASFLQSDGYMRANFQDTMTICKWYGYPDLFITFTCNPKWPEIMRYVTKRGLRPEDRPDILCRVFKMKLAELMKDFKDRQIFGRVIGGTYTIEFQKRGLPHAHILIFLHRDDKFPAPANVDKIISAEIPDPTENPLLYDVVKEHMIHGPCGKDFPNCPCMVASKCSRNFPKRCIDSTTVDEEGYPVYKRREKGFTVLKSGRLLGNESVVPYNAELLLKYRAHINVEWCNQARSIKYLFKYISKGPDRATMQSSYRRRNENNPEQIDEIQRFHDCRYIASCEAVWRIFAFEIHYRTPPVERLRFHLPDEQSVVFNDEDPIDSVIDNPTIGMTKFLAWMDCNKSSNEAQHLLYSQFPTKFVWKKEECAWRPRKNGFALGRMHNVSPNCGELYYMRTLLNFVKGPKCFEDLRRVDQFLHPTFRDACYARGLLGDDREYIDAIEEASHWGSGAYLRNMFVTLLLSGTIAMPSKVWEKTWTHLADDILHRQRNIFQNQALHLTEDELKNYALLDIEACLQRNGSSLRRFQDMPFPESSTSNPANTLVSDELSYDRVALREEHVNLLSSMTNEQKGVYSEIMDAVHNNRGGVFFVHGYGGTGKTFLWRTLCAALRSRGQIVLPVASSGIASTLLPGGMTAHSRLSIPINVVENSTCSRIKLGSDLAELLIKAKLIIWDEAPMTHRHAFEAVDRSLRDVMRFSSDGDVDKPFGGKVVVFGGDFRQILPVITKGSRSDIINASLCSSDLWSYCKVLTLTKNMRLQAGDLCSNVDEIKEFSDWILKVGDGEAGDPNDGEVEIELPHDNLITHFNDPISSIVDAIYPSLDDQLWNPKYLQERAILAPTHEIVELVNDYVLSLIDAQAKIYYSSDEVSKDESNVGVRDLYSTEFGIKCSGLPNHELKLKVGAIVMLLRNIDQSRGLCNGTRLIVTHLGERVIRATVVSGSHKGDKVHIARITLSPSDTSKYPVQFDRRQFPLAVCFAMTINKSQGQSLAHVGLYLPRPVFTHGQLYVAISRVTNKKGLKILICDNDGRASSRTNNVVYQEIFEKL